MAALGLRSARVQCVVCEILLPLRCKLFAEKRLVRWQAYAHTMRTHYGREKGHHLYRLLKRGTPLAHACPSYSTRW
jgi:hypothetical protein